MLPRNGSTSACVSTMYKASQCAAAIHTFTLLAVWALPVFHIQTYFKFMFGLGDAAPTSPAVWQDIKSRQGVNDTRRATRRLHLMVIPQKHVCVGPPNPGIFFLPRATKLSRQPSFGKCHFHGFLFTPHLSVSSFFSLSKPLSPLPLLLPPSLSNTQVAASPLLSVASLSFFFFLLHLIH